MWWVILMILLSLLGCTNDDSKPFKDESELHDAWFDPKISDLEFSSRLGSTSLRLSDDGPAKLVTRLRRESLDRHHRFEDNFKTCIDAFAQQCGLLDTDAERCECVISNRYACFNDR